MQVWPRLLEIVIGCWLLMSPFLFGHYPDHRALWLSDLISGLAIVVISSMSISRKFFRLYLGNLLVAFWIIVHAYGQSPPPGHAIPAIQNELITGLVLGMVAIIPSDTSRPPREWQEFDIESE
ncbi:MAG: SPW repeat protein [Thermoanaerobaculia bacterium]|nr:SPW repeat protein [Thermoanaerobaculia bacterium]